MKRWDEQAVRAFLPAVIVLGVAFALSILLSYWQDDPLLMQRATEWRWAPWLALGLSLLLGARVCVRLWRRRAPGLICPCGGLLRPVRNLRGSAVRACRECGRRWREVR